MRYKIYANHAHVFPKEVWAEASIEELEKLMEACGIEKCVCFAPFYSQVANFTDQPNQWLAQAIQQKNNLFGFGTLDLAEGRSKEHIQAQVKTIADLGFKGIKMHPAYQGFNVAGENAFAAYEAAEKENLFISFHTGIHWHRIKDYQMLLFDEVAYHFPKLRFSMEHVGGYCFFKEALAVMLNNTGKVPYHTVFAGFTSICDREQNRPWYLRNQEIEDLLWQTGYERAIFGLDFPYNDISKTKEAIARFCNMDIPKEAKAAILGGNLARILDI